MKNLEELRTFKNNHRRLIDKLNRAASNRREVPKHECLNNTEHFVFKENRQNSRVLEHLVGHA